MTYREALNYLDSFADLEQLSAYNYELELKLRRADGFLKELGSPQHKLRCAHIAGSKGKGSTCAFLAYILKEAGFRTGLYTSPHLNDFRERIRLLDNEEGAPDGRDFEGMIPEHRLARLVTEIKPAAERYNRDCPDGALSFFEVYTALAFKYFQEKGADLVVLETGMGGRLDATNTADALACGITPISLEHTDKLGKTLEQIAGEKAGIIKNGLTAAVISAPQEQQARAVLQQRCASIGVGFLEAGRDILYKESDFTEDTQRFDLRGVNGEYSGLEIRLLGEHQIVNAAVAVGIIEQLAGQGISISEKAIRGGLLKCLWPVRCEVISKNPHIILDGAQNRASALALKNAIKRYFPRKKVIVVLGASSDKDIEGITLELQGLTPAFILTRSGHARAAKPEVFLKYLKGAASVTTGSVQEAMDKAISSAGKDDLILVCGSLFVAAEAREYVIRKGRHPTLTCGELRL
ncbi:MAG: bifunctional folylpolyglutamate synthase/dihydrofolate synthase [Candidatus Omnitrophica bacterium]|nr:bifunctional folylpolyglutamate synthase/dihydrofolate synthase [Candidatus Omnitrophota bacterium]